MWTKSKIRSIIASFLGSFLILLVVSGVIVYRATAQSMKEQLGNQCLGISTTVAVILEKDLDGYKDFCNTLDTDSAYYKSAKKELENVYQSNSASIRFLYTEIQISDTEVMFILDGDLEDSPLFAPPGSTTEMTVTRRKAYSNKTAHVGDSFTVNEFGTLLSAYAPIVDADGSLIGMVGVDISAERYDSIMRSQLTILVVSISLLVVFAIVLGSGLVRVYEQKLRSDEGSASKSIFLARMSHEIRTPMNAISGMTELMLREELAPVAREHAVNIRQASANLLAIINEILDFAKVESGRMEIIEMPYSLSTLISDVVSVVHMRLVDKPVTLVVDVDCKLPAELIGDGVRLRQIMMNLLSNAVKFTHKGFVSLQIEWTKDQDNKGTLTVRVSDSGIGISEDIDKLFGDFVQLDRKQHYNKEGAGLGLAITKSLCNLMGGDISVASEYGKGSTFTVTLPVRYERYAPFAEVADPVAKRVLIYETRELYADSLKKSLRSLDVSFSAVQTHSEFLTEMQSNSYTHVFVSSFLYDSVGRVAERLKNNASLIALSEFGEKSAFAAGTLLLAMPAHAESIADILSGRTARLYSESAGKAIRFVAPSARVLIVDDVKTNLSVAEGLLSPFRMIVDCALSGGEALEMIRASRYDLVLMDHMMPDMDGIETTVRIRALGETNAYFKDLPIVALTANAVYGMREMLLQNGMNDYLSKPIDIPKLYDALERWIPKEKQQAYIPEAVSQDSPDMAIEGIDLKAGLAMTGGNLENYRRILETFYIDTADKIEQISGALATGNIHLFTTHIHAMKSATASIGAFGLSESAKLLENAGGREDIRYITDNIDTFFALLSRTVESIEKALPEVKNSGVVSAEQDGDELRQSLLCLKRALSEINIGETDKMLAALRNGSWTVKTQKRLAEIDRLVLLFEYESAVEIIDEMLE